MSVCPTVSVLRFWMLSSLFMHILIYKKADYKLQQISVLPLICVLKLVVLENEAPQISQTGLTFGFGRFIFVLSDFLCVS